MKKSLKLIQNVFRKQNLKFGGSIWMKSIKRSLRIINTKSRLILFKALLESYD